MCGWKNIALPSLLYGCEPFPFTDATIEFVERVQAQLAKYILGLPQNAANFCGQTELGWKPFRQVLLERQLCYYRRISLLPPSRWVKAAWTEHTSGKWSSPYFTYILGALDRLKSVAYLPSSKAIRLQAGLHFLLDTNEKVSAAQLPALVLRFGWSVAPYLEESEESRTLVKFRLGVAGLGNRAPRAGRPYRNKWCPLGPPGTPSSELHLVLECPAVESERKAMGLRTTIDLGLLAGLEIEEVYFNLLNGVNMKGEKVGRMDYLSLGGTLKVLLDRWLALW